MKVTPNRVRQERQRSLLPAVALAIAGIGLHPAIAADTPGSTSGKFMVTPDGSSTYSVPIVVSPGTTGMQPSLSLVYSSRGGAGAVGFGWSIGGVSAIQRGPRNLTDDGQVRGVLLDEGDALYLDGMPLIQVAHDDQKGIREFRGRIDGYARVRAYGWTSVGPYRLEVETRAGLKMYYGSADGSRVKLSSGRTLIWLCDRIEDKSGNYITFAYAIDGVDYHLLRVDYTGNAKLGLQPYAKVVFQYEQVGPYELRYILGDRVEPRFQLKSVTSMMGDKVLRNYDLAHQRADQYRTSNYLVALRESGADGLSYRPLKFTYSAARSNWQQQNRLNLPIDFSKLNGIFAGFRFLDLNGDGRYDVIYRASISGTVTSDAYLNNSNGWSRSPQFAPPVDLATDQGINRAVVLRDVTGHDHGLKDIVVSSDRQPSAVYKLTGSGWTGVSAPAPFRFVNGGAPDNRFLFIDVDPAAKNGEELIWNSPPQGAGAAHFDGSTWKSVPGFTPPLPFPVDREGELNGVYSVDVDCDGRNELVYLYTKQDGTKVSAVYKAQSGSWVEMTNAAFQLPFDPVPNSAAIRFADLNGDGCKDVIFAYESAGSRARGAYLASVTGWKRDTRALPDFVLWKDSPSAAVAEVADLNGDGRADIFWNSSLVSPQQDAYLGKANGWQEDHNSAPPTELPARKSERDVLFQVLDVYQTGHPELIYLVSGSAPVFYNFNSGAWTKDASVSVLIDVARFDKVDLGVRFLDLNGDGRTDVAYARKHADGSVEKASYIFDPTSATPWNDIKQFHYPVPTFSDDLKDLGVALVDFNGDGLTDLLVGYTPGLGQTPQLIAYENCSQKAACKNKTGEGDFWRPVAGMAPPEPLAEVGKGPLGVRFADLDGDGLTDMLVSRSSLDPSTPFHAAAYRNTGSGWTPVAGLAPPIEFARPYLAGAEQVPDTGSMRDNNVQLIDLNGDRLPDLVYHFRAFDPKLGFVVKKGAYLNTGTSWKAADAYAPPKRIDQDDTAPYRQVYFQDVNGDGLPDLVYVEKEGDTSRSETYLNTGSGWVREAAYDIPAGAVYASKGDQGFRFLDMNGDRLVDIAYHWRKADNTEVAGTFINTGRGWQQASNSDFVPPVVFTEEGRGDLGVRPADLNGDGIADLLQSYLRDDGNDQRSVYLNLTDTPDQLLTVQDGLGSQTALTYQSVLGLDSSTLLPLGVYQPPPQRDQSYPVVDAPMPGSVVTAVVSQGPGVPPQSTTYRYGEYRVDTRSGRSLGFALQDVRDEARHRVIHLRYLQDDGLVGSIALTETYQGVANPVRLTTSQMTWDPTRTYGETTPSGFQPPIYHPLLTSSQSYSWDLAGTALGAHSDTYEYDLHGNPTFSRTELRDGAVTETRNVYGDDPVNWHLGRLTQAQVTSSAPGKATQVKTARFAYDPATGELTWEVSLAASPLEVTKIYQRDDFGNKTAVTSSTHDGNPDYTTRTHYDDLGRFPIRTWNALGQVSTTTYDDVSGVVLRRVHPNGVTVRTSYDSMQRVRFETSATGVVTTTTPAFPPAGAPDFVALVVTTQTGTLPPRSSFYDGVGRLRIERSIGAGGRPVLAVNEYDVLGRVIRSSAPYFEGDTAVFLTRSYDDLDRVVQEIRPGGLTLSSTFRGLTTQVSDGLGRTTQLIRDVQGRPLATVDQAGGKTSFTYDVSGNLVATTNAMGQTTAVEYNLAGQKVKIVDPALGTWQYGYDAYGNLLSQKSPDGKTVTFKYDAIGRVVERAATGEGTARWQYDAAQHGLGQPARIESSSGISKTFQYDEFGRVAAASIALGADHITATQTYDSLGRPVLRHYSTGLSVANTYDDGGFWTRVSITDRTHSEVVWQGQAFDALGRVVQERFGNGVVTNRTYDNRTGQLLRSTSLAPDLSVLQDFTFEYDAAGNITRKAEAASARTEAFQYDSLNRLTAVSGPVGGATVNYDAIGNIVSKSDTGTYTYCPGPSGAPRLCQISGSGKPVDLAYDSAGNVTRFGKQRFTFDAEGHTLRVVESAWNYENFLYDAEGGLARQEARHGADKFTALNLAESQILYEEFAPPLFPTPERTRVRHYLASPVGTLGYYEFTFWHYPGRFVRPAYDEAAFPVPQRSTELTTSIRYFLQDQIGSVRIVLNERAVVTDRLDFDAWGRRIGQKHAYVYRAMTTGFAGQEHLDGFNLIHMGGRIYSPVLARFLSPDPMVSASGFSQSYNRYSYALNNPLRVIDPSGYNIFGDIWDGIKGAATGIWNAATGVVDWVGRQITNVGNWIADNWRTIVVIAASVALAAVGVPPVLIGALAGGLNAGLYGGSFDDIMRGAILGAVSGAFAQGFAVSLHGAWLVGANAGMGGFMSAAQGGNFWRGLLSSAAAQVFSPLGSISPGTAFRVAAAAAIGGAVSTAMGGSFENGAMTGAFAELFRIAAENATTRYLTKDEKDYARAALAFMHHNDPAFTEDSLNFLDSVRVSTGRFMAAQGDGWVMTPDGNIYWPGGEGLLSNAPLHPGEEPPLQTFTHEIEHLYQYYAQGESVLYKGAWLHTVGRIFNGDPYNIDLTKPYSSYTVEQRGEYLRILVFGSKTPQNCNTVPGGCPY